VWVLQVPWQVLATNSWTFRGMELAATTTEWKHVKGVRRVGGFALDSSG